MTGIKALDKLLTQYGIREKEGADAFQRVCTLQGGDVRLQTLKLPFCFYTLIHSAPTWRSLTVHSFYLPYRKQRLASFLIDEHGCVIEQVFYQRENKYVEACKKVMGKIKLLYQKHTHLAA